MKTMKQRFQSILALSMLSVVLMTWMLAFSAPASASVQPTGELTFAALSGKYEKDALLVKGVFVNISNVKINKVEKFKLTVKDAAGNELATREWDNDAFLTGLSLEPGQSQKWDVTLPGAVQGADLKSLDVAYQMTCATEKWDGRGEGVHIFIDNRKLNPEVAPFIKDGSMLVPLRSTLEALGAKVEWNPETQTVKATKGSDVMTFKIGQKSSTINGKAIQFGVPAQIVDGSSFIPLRDASEALNCDLFVGMHSAKSMTIVIVDKQ
ncbi:copper amine oxidase N-terminal domain-containing protein [Paenibacillus oleatilyticus]|uniref:copper amine oxidase N-terminal domain-containing protein n=1 Tax=Paenibacillus oleatilyticus TaxID=2594886 RepID=UPI001C1F3EE7|nr:copper amine oxidase N-terminal domain-containing protein [Paenibacillus oleatilyticus]MBU7314152.1 copper amine oxidase N-terminal domain-containing protein [Paenibacillus oleatilyticus]